MKGIRIITTNSEYEFSEGTDGVLRLKGNKIKEEDGVAGFFDSDVKVGSRPVFITTEGCTLCRKGEEVKVEIMEGIMLPEIVEVQVLV